MSPGVVSIRCPACGRPFISLPRQPEALVSCPHCAQSAPMAEYRPASTAPNPTLFSERLRMLQQTGPEEAEEEYSYEDEYHPPAAISDQADVTDEAQSFSYTQIDIETSAPIADHSEAEIAADYIDETANEASVGIWTKRSLSLFLLILLGIVAWTLWEKFQPPLRVDIPVTPPPATPANQPPANGPDAALQTSPAMLQK